MTRVSGELEEYLLLPPLPSTQRGYGLHLGGTLLKRKRLLYCSGNLVIQRDLEDMTQVVMNSCHQTRATTAQFSPNGEWVCSGDESGKVLVWADASMVQKGEGVTVGRAVLDISWSGDSQRIMAVGRGKEEKGKVFPWNSGGKLGEITGATAALLACSFKPSRPFRVVASSEDFGVFFYKGPPFKYESHDKSHKNYVNSVRYSPNGDHYISVGSDKKIQVFDGKGGTKQREIATGAKKKNEHTGSIYEVCWNADSTKFMTASADKTCKLWDFESGTVEHTWKFGMRRACDKKPGVTDMQLACLWLGEYMISVSLSGHIAFLTTESETPTRLITGHQKSVVSLAVDGEKGFVYSADSDGRLIRTHSSSGDAEDLLGEPHNGKPLKAVAISCDKQLLYTVANDDAICVTNIADTESVPLTFGASEEEKSSGGEKLDGAGRCLAAANSNGQLVAVGTHKQKLQIFGEGLALIQSLDLACSPTSLSFSMDDSLIAVGGEDCNIYLFQAGADGKYALFRRICSPSLIKKRVVSVAFQPGKQDYLCSADANRQIWLWKVAEIVASEDDGLSNKDVFRPANEAKSYQFHRAIAGSLAWNPDGTMLVSGGHDSQLIVWTNAAEAGNDYVRKEAAFFESIRDVSWIDSSTVVAASSDATVRFFKLTGLDSAA